jgi:coenzyme F420-reducing hydrogenase delta subunit
VKNSTNLDKVEKDIKKDNELVNKKVDQILKSQPIDSKKVNVNQTSNANWTKILNDTKKAERKINSVKKMSAKEMKEQEMNTFKS